ncbi:hypothetical protein [Ornithinibacillus halotolerans]|uniref:Uncharacterized protein n=1 Tax=Ornithinibacillus halotolerans TaxID=1274357 RepID=A0A916WE40_9BACI|nr:hypothetical protein [Ornithinibacillus halotolerans]GGA90206.1 hypothetical protein GCM10008025_36020 [Ornithinibacillus halotolerans]
MDRLLYGEMTDVIIRSGGVLNIADHAIELGVLLLLLSVITDWFKEKGIILLRKEVLL